VGTRVREGLGTASLKRGTEIRAIIKLRKPKGPPETRAFGRKACLDVDENTFSRRNFLRSGALAAAGFTATSDVSALAQEGPSADEPSPIRLGLVSYTFRNFSRAFQGLFQQPSHAYLTRGANAGYNRVTTSSQSRLASMATTLSSPIPNSGGRLTFQRLSLVAVSGQRRHKHPMKSSAVCFLMIVAARFADPIASLPPNRFARDEPSWPRWRNARKASS
jgi:hypothetical protein